MLGRPGTLINCIERYLRIIASGKMKIESVDFFYLSIPEVLDIGDGSQDVLLVRLQAGYHVGWGECEAALLVSTASRCVRCRTVPVNRFKIQSWAKGWTELATLSVSETWYGKTAAWICCKPTTCSPVSI